MRTSANLPGMKEDQFDTLDTFGSNRIAPVETAEAGFTLIETTIAMVIILVAMLAVAQAFTFAIIYNAGNATRTQALAILQQETETLRSKKFSPATTDLALTGGTREVRYVTSPNGGNFSVADVIDDDPFTDGIQIDANSTIKEITVTVRLASPSPGWQVATAARIVMRRTRGN